MTEAYPLHWPAGYKRADFQSYSRFRTTAAAALQNLLKELRLLTGDNKNVVISSNVPLKKNGEMYADVASDTLDDPGVAVYFMYDGQQVVLCCDAWKTPAENVHAIGNAVNAIRGIGRWEVSDFIKRSFTGFKAIPETITRPWWVVLEIPETASQEEKKAAYYRLAAIRHPDKATGSHDAFTELIRSYQEARKEK